MSALPSTNAVPIDVAPLWRVSVERYHEMIGRGVLGPDDHVELLEGFLVDRMSTSPTRRIATRLARRALEAIVPDGWYVEAQDPLTLPDSEPEPDVAIIRGDTSDYPDRHPGPSDVMLVVEIAGASLARDRTVKKRVYARAGIPIYWIVDLVGRRVEAYAEPSGEDYSRSDVFQAGQRVPLPFGEISVDSLLP